MQASSRYNVLLVIALSALAVTACGGSDQTSGASQEEISEEQAPDWHPTPPKDSTYVYGSGFALSTKKRIAIEKATANARDDAASQLRRNLENMTSSLSEETSRELDQEFQEKSMRGVVSEATVEKQKRFRGQYGAWHTFVLVKQPIEQAIEKLKEESQTAELVVESRFRESSGNDRLETNEKGTLILSVFNEGQKAAREVSVSLRLTSAADGVQIGSNQNLVRSGSFTEISQLGELSPDTVEEVTIPLQAVGPLPSKDLHLDVRVDRAGEAGLDSSKQLTIPIGEVSSEPITTLSDESQSAELVVESRFRESSGNDRLETDEKGALILSVSNEGRKEARDVSLSFRLETTAEGVQIGSDQNVVRSGSFTEVGQLGELSPDTVEQVTIPLQAVGPLPSKELRLDLRVDAAGEAGLKSPKQIRIPVGEAPSEPIVDSRIPWTGEERPNDIAVVIGNKEYKHADIPDVDYAVRDASIIKKYLTRTLGFREKNIIYVENAGAAEMTRIFGTAGDPNGQLYTWTKPGESDVFVYYSGHGAPNPESGNAYFIPSDANPNYLSQNGYPASQLYENLAKVPANSVTVVLEACFSGTSEAGTVVQEISPAVLSVENPVIGLENGLALTAGAADQVSSWYSEKKHGLFTYYFLKGLRGNADRNADRAITAKEMESYLKEKVPYRARRMHNREQTPQVVGRNMDRVLVEYENEVPAN